MATVPLDAAQSFVRVTDPNPSYWSPIMRNPFNSMTLRAPKVLLLVALIALGIPLCSAAHAPIPAPVPQPTAGKLLTTGLMGTIGGTIGPDGALYVPQGALGTVSRIDPWTGRRTTFVSGLPPAIAGVGIGGPMDIAFVGNTAYVLVSLVSSDVGGDQIDGIYRVDGKDTFTVIADLGQFSADNPPPPTFSIVLSQGLQFALQPIEGGFLVSDGHHNRILHATLNGDVSVLKQFDDVVPTGLAATADRLYVAELGPVPDTADTGKVVAFDLLDSDAVRVVAAGVSMIVDVEFGPHGQLYALSQGIAPDGIQPAQPALPNTGRLLRVNNDGTFTVLVDKLNQPTSLHFVCDTALVVTLGGQVWRIDGADKLPQRGGDCDDCGHGRH